MYYLFCLGHSGEGIDVLYGSRAELTAINELPFAYRVSPINCKRSIEDVKKMAPRQHVSYLFYVIINYIKHLIFNECLLLIFSQIGLITGRIVHLNVRTKNVEYQGRQLETKTSILEDITGKIKVQLWEDQVGSVSYGETYQFTNLTTREFKGELFLTTTKDTIIEKVQPLLGLGPIPPNTTTEEPVKSIYGIINRAKVLVSRCCGNCKFWQVSFETKKKFHRCEKCNMLQMTAMFKPTAHVTVFGDFGERNLTINNSVLQVFDKSSH